MSEGGAEAEEGLLLLPPPAVHSLVHAGWGGLGLLLDRLEVDRGQSTPGHYHPAHDDLHLPR